MGTSYSPTFAYQDSLYFLTQGNGPWGNRAWTYDKIGNRLTFARTSEPTQSYAYSGTGHNPKLATITPAPGWGTGSWLYSYDPAGNQTSVLESNDEGAVQTTFYDIAADGRMNTLRTDTGPSKTDFLYDGRGYLREGLLTVAASSDNLRVTPVYSSEGTLMARTEVRQYTGSTIGPDGEDQISAQMSNETTQLFYFAGRPVAQLTSGPDLLYLTTDHLGTPVLATDTSGAAVWAGGVEPFGRTWTAGIDNPDPEFSSARGIAAEPSLDQLSSEKVFLRYPGQWDSDLFRVTGTQHETYYNLHRYYMPGTGRYTSPDPEWHPRRAREINPFSYVASNPIMGIDPLGLMLFRVCCNDWDKQNLSRMLQQAADIQRAYINQTPLPPALGFGPHAVTTCEIFNPPGPGEPTTTYRNFGQGTCADACTRMHEQSHREECRRRDFLSLEMGRSRWVAEAIAYAKEAECLTKAILQGSIEIDVDPMGPRNDLE